ncbi:toll/interleukin-1 receptor domain-containing protein [Rhodohalobacter sp. 8-1]|uniref:toll/interleukin-1 receptor domain-containing protein n=1 Tax=Rhodohalobacter sp. 8-1 TaxID=3131972 RepID=UPI0030EC4036
MPKVFLSHSSKDKKYVRQVIKELRKSDIIYDEFSFEAGGKTLDEIMNGLNKTDLFVLFISENSLKSEWVEREMDQAQGLEERNLVKILPIIIDPNISYKSTDIPKWLTDHYNVKYVARPVIFSRLIKQKLQELSWEKHPTLEARKSIFVGRNGLIREFEQRIDDYDLDLPCVIFASGLPNIGRKSLMKHCLIKSNVVLKQSFQPYVIPIDSHESIEDFILKCYDLGISADISTDNLISKSIEQKADIACKLINDIQSSDEIIFIEDTGGIILPGGHIANWFLKILELGCINQSKIALCISSRFNTNKGFLNRYDSIYYMEVPELSRSERKGLFKRYCDLKGLRLSSEDLKFFSQHLSGYPMHVYYTSNFIKKNGLPYAKKNVDKIREFNHDQISTLLTEFEDDAKAFELLRLLSEFDFISYDFLSTLLENEEISLNYIDDFINKAICELFGRNKEYIRLIDAVRNYIMRGNKKLSNKYEKNLKRHVDQWVKNEDLHVEDISNFFISIKKALNNGFKIPKKYLIPSHYLKSMIDKYQNDRDYSGVIDLGRTILENEENLDEFILREIKYWVCLSYARMASEKFLEEVQFFRHTREYDFLLGYYYRRIGKFDQAIDRFLLALQDSPNFHRAKHELVQSYMDNNDYKNAKKYAKENYIHSTTNPLHIQSYFICILNTTNRYDKKTVSTLDQLIHDLEKVKTERGKEIELTTKSRYYQIVKKDTDKALEYAENGIADFPNSPYPLIQKFEILRVLGKTAQMSDTLDKLRLIVGEQSIMYIMRKAILMTLNGEIYDAKYLIDNTPTINHFRKRKLTQELNEIEQSQI